MKPVESALARPLVYAKARNEYMCVCFVMRRVTVGSGVLCSHGGFGGERERGRCWARCSGFDCTGRRVDCFTVG